MNDRVILDKIDDTLKNKRTVFLLCDREIPNIPPEIFQLSDISTLWLRRCQIVNVPPSIKKLYNLNSLNLDENQIFEISSDLELQGNQIAELPKEFSDLDSLEWLEVNMSYSEISSQFSILWIKYFNGNEIY